MPEKEKRDYYQEVTDNIIKAMEEGTTPWQKGWDDKVGSILAGTPINGMSGKAYTKENVITLMIAMNRRGSNDPRFYTFNQAKKLGFRVRKGAKATLIKQGFWATKDKAGLPLPPEDQHWTAIYSPVFHASDVCKSAKYIKDENGKQVYRDVLDKDGNPVMEPVEVDGQEVMRPLREPVIEYEPIPAYKPKSVGYTHEEKCELAEAMLVKSGARIFNDQASSNFYRPSTDEIHLMPREAFPDIMNYYATALHELGHWTGHASRLNRPKGNGFGTPEYAKEELRAELASVFLSADLGIPVNMDNHAAYLKNWLGALKEDKMEIFKATNDAIKITGFLEDFIRDRLKSREKEQDKPEVVGEDKPIEKDKETTPVQSETAAAEEPKPSKAEDISKPEPVPADVQTGHPEEVQPVAASTDKPLQQVYIAIHQMADTPENHYLRFNSWEEATAECAKNGKMMDFMRYEDKYTEKCEIEEGTPLNAILDQVYERHNRDDRPSADIMHSLAVSDVIQVNERYFYVDKTGFKEFQPHPIRDKSLMREISNKQIQTIAASQIESYGEKGYNVYRQKFGQLFCNGSDSSQGKDDAMGRYKKFIFDNAARFELSSVYVDSKAWEKADAAFFAQEMERSLNVNGYVDRADIYMAKMVVTKLNPYLDVTAHRGEGGKNVVQSYTNRLTNKAIDSKICRENPEPQKEQIASMATR